MTAAQVPIVLANARTGVRAEVGHVAEKQSDGSSDTEQAPLEDAFPNNLIG